MKDVIKAVILCGGMGTRLKEETEYIPKPMVDIGGKPILWHIMKTYSHYMFNDFVLCVGYKGEIIKNYFLDYRFMTNDFTVYLGSEPRTAIHKSVLEPWNVTLAETGLKTGTGGRIKKIQRYVGNTFFVTYGDGVGDVNIIKLLQFHKSHGKIATITAVHPPSRFGLLDVEDEKVIRFNKNVSTSKGWIDGGFFVFNRDIFNYLENIDDEDMLEGQPLEKLANDGQLMAYKHEGYWKCMDTYRDMKKLKSDVMRGNARWMVWNE